MPQKSLVDILLTPEDRKSFDSLIAEGRLSIDGLVDWLTERGYEISRSSVHRHSTRISAVAEQLRQSRAVTDALAKELGDSAAQGEQGRLLVEMTRSMVFEFLSQTNEDGTMRVLDTKSFMMLGKGLAELSKAMRLDQDFEDKIAEKVAARVKAEAVEVIEKAAKANQKGLTRDTAEFIKAQILGVKVQPEGGTS